MFQNTFQTCYTLREKDGDERESVRILFIMDSNLFKAMYVGAAISVLSACLVISRNLQILSLITANLTFL